MSTAVISKRYAEALFQLAQEKKIADAMESELLIVKEVFQQNQDFILLLESPSITTDKKHQLVNEAFHDFSVDVVNTLKLLVERHHEAVIPHLVDEFVTLINESKGIKVATVYSVRALSEEEAQQLADVFQEKLHIAKLKINNVVDSSLIGGVKLHIGNTVYDGSVIGKLERMKKTITAIN